MKIELSEIRLRLFNNKDLFLTLLKNPQNFDILIDNVFIEMLEDINIKLQEENEKLKGYIKYYEATGQIPEGSLTRWIDNS